jgi:hypothetical protein
LVDPRASCRASVYISKGKRCANTVRKIPTADHTVIAEKILKTELREVTGKVVKRSHFDTPPVAKLIHLDATYWWRYTPRMKLRDIIEWSERWSTPSCTPDEDAPVADGVLIGLNLWGISIINLVVQCPEGRYCGSIIAPEPVIGPRP